MPELETTSFPPLQTAPQDDQESTVSPEAPYGYKTDGSPAKKRGRPAGSSGGSGNRGGNDRAFAERISGELIELSAPLGIISPLAVLHIAERADRTANALVIVSKKHPAVKVAIESYFNSVAYKDLALFVLGIPVAIMIDMGMLKPTTAAGKVWGFEAKWEELYNNEDGTEFHSNGNAPARGLAGEI